LEIADELEGSIDPESDGVTGLSSGHAENIQQLALNLRGTLEAEASVTFAFVVRPKRYDTTRLTGDIGSLMPEGCFEGLAAMTKFDLEEAGRCIAFERSTAAAFHLMRAVESELRGYYMDWVRSSRIDEPRMWGPMVADLRKRSSQPRLWFLMPSLMFASTFATRRSTLTWSTPWMRRRICSPSQST
jgi:hypothetical protein